MSKACNTKETNCSSVTAKNKNYFKKEICNSTHRGAYLNPHFNCNIQILIQKSASKFSISLMKQNYFLVLFTKQHSHIHLCTLCPLQRPSLKKGEHLF